MTGSKSYFLMFHENLVKQRLNLEIAVKMALLTFTTFYQINYFEKNVIFYELV